MNVSAELRWFWQINVPTGLMEWFEETLSTTCPPGGIKANSNNDPREDRYLADKELSELGLKLRDGKPGVEIKGLVGREDTATLMHPFTGRIELWRKWKSEVLGLNDINTVTVHKFRRMRKFDTSGANPIEIPLDEKEKPKNNAFPENGCNFELTQVALADGSIWWTLGLEAFGSPKKVGASLRLVVSTLIAQNPPDLTDALEASYPKWLAQYALVSNPEIHA